MMNFKIIVLTLLIFMGCKRPFSPGAETALVVPLIKEKGCSVVFIAGFDTGDNKYYTNAERHFREKGIQVVNDLFSLEEIIVWLNRNADRHTPYNEIHIVSHGNPWVGLSLKTVENGRRITLKTVRKARRFNKLPKNSRHHYQRDKDYLSFLRSWRKFSANGRTETCVLPDP